MEEYALLRALLAEQAKLLNHIKTLLQRVQNLAASSEKSYQGQPMCMDSSCCRNLDDTNNDTNSDRS